MMDEASCEPDERRAPARLQGTVFWLLRRAARDSYRLTQERLVDAGLRYGFYGVLATLVEFGPGTQAEIGRRLGIDRSDMVAILNALEAEEFVRREQNPADRRSNRVTVTRAGRGALTRFDRAIADAEETLLGSFAPPERTALVEMLTRLVDPVGEPERTGGAAPGR